MFIFTSRHRKKIFQVHAKAPLIMGSDSASAAPWCHSAGFPKTSLCKITSSDQRTLTKLLTFCGWHSMASNGPTLLVDLSSLHGDSGLNQRSCSPLRGTWKMQTVSWYSDFAASLVGNLKPLRSREGTAHRCLGSTPEKHVVTTAKHGYSWWIVLVIMTVSMNG